MSNLKTRCKCYRVVDSANKGNSIILEYLEIPVSISTSVYRECFELHHTNNEMLPWPKHIRNRLLTVKDSIYDEENCGPTMDLTLYPVFIYHIGYNSDLEYLFPLDSNLVSGLILSPLTCTKFVAMNWDSPRDQFLVVTGTLSIEDLGILPVEISVSHDMIPGRVNWNKLMVLLRKFRSTWIEYDTLSI